MSEGTGVVVRGRGEGEVCWLVGIEQAIKLASDESGQTLSVVDCEASRGAGPPLHVHANQDEAFYVIEGELAFFAGDDEIAGGPGSFVYLPRGVPHAFVVESERARFLGLGTPGMDRFFLEAGTAAPESGPVDVEAITAVAARYGIEILGPPPPTRSNPKEEQ